MQHDRCLICSHVGRLLDEASRDAYVEYYRCDDCGHVWARDKQKPNAPPKSITIPPERNPNA
jgi:hypothetical protein